MYAAGAGRPQIVKALLDGGANPKVNTDILTAAAGAGYPQIVKVLLDGGANPNQTEKYGETALMFAADNGHSEAAQYFARQRRRSESGKRKRQHGFDRRGC